MKSDKLQSLLAALAGTTLAAAASGVAAAPVKQQDWQVVVNNSLEIPVETGRLYNSYTTRRR